MTKRIVFLSVFLCSFLCVSAVFAADDVKVQKLAAKLATLSGDNVIRFTDSLSKADRKALAGEMAIRLKKLQRSQLSPKDKALLKGYARSATALRPSEEKPISDPILKTLLCLEETFLKSLSMEQLERMGPHRCAGAFGKIDPAALKKTQTLTLSSRSDKKGTELVATGLYAVPGKAIAIAAPKDLVDAKITVVIGHHRSVRPSEKAAYISMPDSRRQFPISSEKTKAINPHGGLIMLSVPKDVGLDKARFIISGAIEAPRFVLGSHSDQQWKQLRNAPAPWGELVCDNLVMIVHSEALRELDDPTALMTWWDKAVGDHEGFYNYDRGMPFRMHTTHHARMGVSYWPLEWSKGRVDGVIDYRKLRAYSDGLFLHEHGHHADDGRMFFGNIGESTPNWAGYYMKGTKGDFAWKDTEETHLLSLFDAKNSHHQEVMEDQWWTKKYTHYWSYPMTSVVVGYVNGFGWESFKKVVHRFTEQDDKINSELLFNPEFMKKPRNKRTPEETKGKDQVIIDKWLVMLSEQAGQDIRPYMGHFQLKPSPKVSVYMDSMKLPKWDLLYAPGRSVIISADKSVSIAAPEKTALTWAKGVTRTSLGKVKNGKLTDNGDTLTYTPAKGFTGRETVSYSLKAQNGGAVDGELEIYVVPEKENPHMRLGEFKSVLIDDWKTVRFERSYRDPVFFASVVVDKSVKRPRGSQVVVRVRSLSASGCKVSVNQVAGETDTKPYDLTWFVIEAGSYESDRHGIMGEVLRRTVVPEILSEKMAGEMTDSYDDDLQWLRAARFGQVLTTNNSKWSDFYFQDVRDQCALRFGCQQGRDGTKGIREKIGFAMLSQGLYQFGDVSARIGRNSISSNDVTVNMSGSDLKQALRRMRK